MQSEIVDRIKIALEVLDITRNKLSTQSGYKSNSQVYRILNKQHPPSIELVLGLLSNHPSINAEWLMLGTGKMLKADYVNLNKIQKVAEQPSTYIKGTSTTKLVGIKQQGQYIVNYDYAEYLNDLPEFGSDQKELMRDFESTTAACKIIDHGDILRCINRPLNKLFGKVTSDPFKSVIITSGNVVIGKASVKGDTITIDNNGMSTSIPRTDVTEAWQIVYIIKKV